MQSSFYKRELNFSLSPVFTLIIGLLCISFSPIFVKLANVEGLASAFYRLLIAGAFVIPISLLKGGLKIKPASILLSMLGGMFFAFDLACWNVSLLITNATLSSLFANLAPVWTGLGVILLFKQIPRKWYWLGTLIAIAGMVMTLGIGNVLEFKVDRGIILAIMASLFYASYILTTTKARKNMDTLHFMSWAMVGGILTLLVICVGSEASLSGFATHSWIMLAGLGLVSQLMGWLCINHSLGFIASNTVSVVLLLQAVFTGILAFFFLGEVLSMQEILGGMVVLIGITLAVRQKK
jgi:drug/metabolite transporter (DMT)-like permease